MWGVSYFWMPRGKWNACRRYPTLDEAVDDFIKLFRNNDVGAVRLYEPGYRPDDDFLWHDEKINQEQRQRCAVAAARMTM